MAAKPIVGGIPQNDGVLKRYRYRAYPTRGQEASLARAFGCARTVYNDVLSARANARALGEEPPTSAELSRRLTESKRSPERAWLSEVSAVVLQQALFDAERAHRNFINSLMRTRTGPRMGAPRYKSRRDLKQAIRFSRSGFSAVVETTHGVGFVSLARIGRLRFTLDRELPSAPTSLTLVREADGRYYVSFVVDVPASPLPITTRTIGIDLGLTDLAAIVSSDGSREKIGNPRHLRARERALKRSQRSLARSKRGSANYTKKQHRLAVLHRKVRQTRLDHHHKLAHRLVHENQVIAVEGLNVRALARTQLAKSVHDAGWGSLLRLIQEKATTHGRTVIRIGQFEPTTRVCAVCRTNGGKKSLDVRVWTCSTCFSVLDRDFNAAVNIMVAAGLAETLNACGGIMRLTLASAVPTKQEPTEQAPSMSTGPA